MFEDEGGISWQTVETRRERIIHEDLINPKHGYKHKEFIEENELESMISVPLIVVNEVIGVLNSYSKGKYQFLDKEVHLLKNLATRAAIAIKSAELTKQMEDINEKILDTAQLANPGQVARPYPKSIFF
jgi:GAF domain-containing protein